VELVDLGLSIGLKNVLHTAAFKYNLISTQKLAVDEYCVISYGPNFCVI